MIKIDGEWSLIDNKNNLVIKSYKINNNEIARIIMDIAKEDIRVEGDLYSLLGYSDTQEDKLKYQEYLKIEYKYAKKILKSNENC